MIDDEHHVVAKDQMTNYSEVIAWLDAEWDEGGLFDSARDGRFDPERGDALLRLLATIEIAEDQWVPKRLVTLLWFLPSFLEWQTERIGENGGDTGAYVRFTNQVMNVLQSVLGMP